MILYKYHCGCNFICSLLSFSGISLYNILCFRRDSSNVILVAILIAILIAILVATFKRYIVKPFPNKESGNEKTMILICDKLWKRRPILLQGV